MKAEMKRVPNMLRFVVAFVCVLALGTVVLAQGESEKTWDDAVALFNQAFEAQQAARYEDAIILYEDALVIVRALEQQPAEGIILYNLGICYASLFEYQRAISYYEKSLVIKRNIDDRAGEADTLSNLGNCYYYRRFRV